MSALEQQYDFTPEQLAELRRMMGETNPNQNSSMLGDIGTSLKVGALKLPGAITGLADVANPLTMITGVPMVSRTADALGEFTGFQPSKWAREAQDEYSQATAEQQQRVHDAQGFWNTAGEYLNNPRALTALVGEALPGTFAGGAIGAGVRGIGAKAVSEAAGGVGPAMPGLLARKFGDKAGAVAAGIGEGAIGAGMHMDEMLNAGADPRVAAATAIPSGALTGLLGYGGGRIANRLGLEDLDTFLTGGWKRAGMAGDEAAMAAARPGWASVAARIGGGMLSEGLLEELPQSMQEQVWQNLALGQPWNQGVLEAGAAGMMAGAAMGGGFQGVRGALQQLAPAPGQPPAAEAPPAVEPSPPDAQPAQAGALDLTSMQEMLQERMQERGVAEQPFTLDLTGQGDQQITEPKVPAPPGPTFERRPPTQTDMFAPGPTPDTSYLGNTTDVDTKIAQRKAERGEVLSSYEAGLLAVPKPAPEVYTTPTIEIPDSYRTRSSTTTTPTAAPTAAPTATQGAAPNGAQATQAKQSQQKEAPQATAAAAEPAEITAARELVAAVDKGGVPLNPAKVNQIARNLGLEVSKVASADATIKRIREALARTDSQRANTQQATAQQPAQPAATQQALQPKADEEVDDISDLGLPAGTSLGAGVKTARVGKRTAVVRGFAEEVSKPLRNILAAVLSLHSREAEKAGKASAKAGNTGTAASNNRSAAQHRYRERVALDALRAMSPEAAAAVERIIAGLRARDTKLSQFASARIMARDKNGTARRQSSGKKKLTVYNASAAQAQENLETYYEDYLVELRNITAQLIDDVGVLERVVGSDTIHKMQKEDKGTAEGGKQSSTMSLFSAFYGDLTREDITRENPFSRSAVKDIRERSELGDFTYTKLGDYAADGFTLGRTTWGGPTGRGTAIDALLMKIRHHSTNGIARAVASRLYDMLLAERERLGDAFVEPQFVFYSDAGRYDPATRTNIATEKGPDKLGRYSTGVDKAGKPFAKIEVTQSGQNAEIVLHEILHHMLAGYIESNGDANLVKHFSTLHKHVAAAMKKADFSKVPNVSAEGVANLQKIAKILASANGIQEFLTYGLTNADFQAYLATVEAPTEAGFVAFLKDAWTAFSEMVRLMIGLPMEDRSALKAFMRLSGNFFDDAYFSQYTGKTLNAKQSKSAYDSVVKFWSTLSDTPGLNLFRTGRMDRSYGAPDKAYSIEQIFAAHMPAEKGWKLEEVRIPAGSVRSTGEEFAKQWRVTLPNKQTATIVEDTAGRITVSTAGMTPGNETWRVLSAALAYAFYNKKTFIGEDDILTMSDAALARYTDAMMSAAIKFGTTDFMEPSRRQRNPSDTIDGETSTTHTTFTTSDGTQYAVRDNGVVERARDGGVYAARYALFVSQQDAKRAKDFVAAAERAGSTVEMGAATAESALLQYTDGNGNYKSLEVAGTPTPTNGAVPILSPNAKSPLFEIDAPVSEVVEPTKLAESAADLGLRNWMSKSKQSTAEERYMHNLAALVEMTAKIRRIENPALSGMLFTFADGFTDVAGNKVKNLTSADRRALIAEAVLRSPSTMVALANLQDAQTMEEAEVSNSLFADLASALPPVARPAKEQSYAKYAQTQAWLEPLFRSMGWTKQRVAAFRAWGAKNKAKLQQWSPKLAGMLSLIDSNFNIDARMALAIHHAKKTKMTPIGLANEFAERVQHLGRDEIMQAFAYLDGNKGATVEAHIKQAADNLRASYEALVKQLPDDAARAYLTGLSVTEGLVFVESADMTASNNFGSHRTNLLLGQVKQTAIIDNLIAPSNADGTPSTAGKFYRYVAAHTSVGGPEYGFIHESLLQATPNPGLNNTLDVSMPYKVVGDAKKDGDTVRLEFRATKSVSEMLKQGEPQDVRKVMAGLQNTVNIMSNAVAAAQLARDTAQYGANAKVPYGSKQIAVVYDDAKALEAALGHAPTIVQWSDSSQRAEHLTSTYRSSNAWIQVPSTPAYGALSGKLVRGPEWMAIDDTFNRSQVINNRTANALMRGFKSLNTAWNIPSHITNTGSNAVLAYMHNISGSTLFDALKLYVTYLARPSELTPEQHAILNDFHNSGALIADFSTQEAKDVLHTAVKDSIDNKGTDGLYGLTNAMLKYKHTMLGKAAALVRDKALDLNDFNRMIYMAEDNAFRLAMFMTTMGDLERTDPGMERAERVSKAGDEARRAFVDYDISSRAVQMARQTVLPFVSWTYGILPVLGRIALDQPWKIATVLGALTLVTSLAAAGDGDDEEAERKRLGKDARLFGPFGPYMEARFPLADDKSGNPGFINLGRFVPNPISFREQPNGFMGVKNWPSGFQPGGPYMLAAAMFYGIDPYTGKKLSSDADTNMEAFLKNLQMGWQQMMPKGGYSAVIPGTKASFAPDNGPLGDPPDGVMNAFKLFGIPVSRVNENEATYNWVRKMTSSDRAFDERVSQDKRKLQRGNIDTDEFVEEAQTMALRKAERRALLMGD